MIMQHLSRKCSKEQQTRFMENAIWNEAVKKGLCWSSAMLNEEAVKSVFYSSGLAAHTRALLVAFIFTYGPQAIEEEKLIVELRRKLRMSGSECRYDLQVLKRAGILFDASKAWGERIWFIPADSYPLWLSAAVADRLVPVSEVETEQALMGDRNRLYPFRRPFSRQLLSACARLAQSGLSRTAKRLYSKKTIKELVDSTEIDDALLQALQVQSILQESYPLAASFILESIYVLGLIEQKQGELWWNEEKLSDWLNSSSVTRERALMKSSFCIIFTTSTLLSHFYAMLYTLQCHEWYSSEQAMQWLSGNGLLAAGQDEAAVRNVISDSCRLLHSFGWLELVELEESGGTNCLFRLLYSPLDAADWIESPTAPIIIQSNGELLASPECSFIARWELELIAERRSDEQMTTYAFTFRTLARAMENGRTKEGIMSFLEEFSNEPIEPIVEALLSEWTSRACRTEAAEDALACGGKRTGSRAVPILSLSDPKMRRGDALVKHDSPSAAYLYRKQPLHSYELIETDPSGGVERLAKMRAAMPYLWLKQLRSYHHSTRKEMIQQALSWEAALQLQLEGRLHDFIPERLLEGEDGWAVQGLLRNSEAAGELLLTPEMWGEMKVIIPNYSS